MGAGILSAIAASVCCIVPVIAVIAGTSGIASMFSWLDPARPFFIGITVLALGFAWHQKFKPAKAEAVDCDCVSEKPTFFQSRTFLFTVTIVSALLLAFPYYASIFYPEDKPQTTTISNSLPPDKTPAAVIARGTVHTAECKIPGMDCEACTVSIQHELLKHPGVIAANVSYEKKTATIRFDSSKTSMLSIVKTINSTGFTVTTCNNIN